MSRTIIFSFILLLILSCRSNSDKITKIESVVQSEKPLKHLVRQPKVRSKNPPILFLIHGYGANESDLFDSLNKHFDDRFIVVSLRAPIVLGEESFAWYPLSFKTEGISIALEDEEKGAKVLKTNIDKLVESYNADKENIFLLGFSQGAILSSYLVIEFPEIIKGAVVLSGRLPVKFQQENLNSDFENISVFISHGINDRVINISEGRKLHLLFDKSGSDNVIYKEHTGAHGIDNKHFSDILKWLSLQINDK